ncbi:MAG TPA: hypothetical protein VFC30_01910 [Solirubrobacteraceae bacterium]|nr:hypothetical protein [Solirubrobacteraceae bacterium]
MKIDIHQHLWTEPLVQALASRRELPFVRHEHGLTVLFLAGERPYVIDLAGEAPSRRAALVEEDGLERALLCLSSPLGIETLPRAQSAPLLDAYHEGALALGDPFGVWGSIALDRPDPADVERSLDRGCIGISLPAGALAGVERLARLRPVLERLELRGAPLLVHPGPDVPPAAGATQASTRPSRCTSTRRRSPGWAPTSWVRTACSSVTPWHPRRSSAPSSGRVSYPDLPPSRRSTPTPPSRRGAPPAIRM